MIPAESEAIMVENGFVVRHIVPTDDPKKTHAIEPMIEKWIEEAASACLKPIKTFIKTIRNHYNGIVKSIKTGITNAVSEGLNSVMQLARSRARGYRNPDNFIKRVYYLGNA